jgi:hypothetical protein
MTVRRIEGLVCWRCGAPLDELPQPLSREAYCPQCEAQIHVCRMCRHYEPRWRQGCREERAEEVRERDRANFCDWFTPRPDAHSTAGSDKAATAKARLDSLFGEGADESDGNDPSSKLDDLFKT